MPRLVGGFGFLFSPSMSGHFGKAQSGTDFEKARSFLYRVGRVSPSVSPWVPIGNAFRISIAVRLREPNRPMRNSTSLKLRREFWSLPHTIHPSRLDWKDWSRLIKGMSGLMHAALVVHIVSGIGALATGSMSVIGTKGSARHRRWGRRFGACIVAVLASAALLTIVALNPYFAALTLSATLGAFSGIRVLRRKRPDREAADRATALDWVVTVTLLTLSLALLSYTAAGGIPRRQQIIYGLTGATILYAGYDILRFLRPSRWPFFPRLWFYEHLVKMLGAFAAVLSAFSGSVLTFLPVPDPWKQLWPTILFYLITIVMILRYARKPAAPV